MILLINLADLLSTSSIRTILKKITALLFITHVVYCLYKVLYVYSLIIPKQRRAEARSSQKEM